MAGRSGRAESRQPLNIFFGGGINEQDEFNVQLDECTAGQNFRLDAVNRQFRPRAPQDLVGSASPNAATITAIMQLIKRDDTQTQLVASGNTLYSWDFSTFTSEATIVTDSRLRGAPWLLDQILAISDLDLQNPLGKWDGTDYGRLKHQVLTSTTTTLAAGALTRSGSTATVVDTSHGFSTDDLVTIAGAAETEYNGQHQITVPGANSYTFPVSGAPATTATGTITQTLGSDLRAKYAIEFNNRMWLFNIQADGTNTPHMVLASAYENAESYDTAARGRAGGVTASVAFFDLVPDLRPINGVAELFGTLVISTENGRLFRLVGQDATDYRWLEFYPGSSAISEEALLNIGNDVHVMRNGGHVDSLRSTDNFGDVAADDLTRFIPTQISSLTSALSVYDQTQQTVLWFVSGKVLVWDKTAALTNPQRSPWSVYKTAMSNAFATSAATYIRRSDKTWTVYWGDSAGIIYDFNGSGTSGDAGTTNVEVCRTHRRIEEINVQDSGLLMRVEYKRRGETALSISIDWSEEYNTSGCEVPLKAPLTAGTPPFFDGSFYFGGTSYFNEGEVTTTRISSVGASPVGRGGSFTPTFTVNSTIDFQISRIAL